MVEELLQLLVGEVDAELLKAIELRARFEAVMRQLQTKKWSHGQKKKWSKAHVGCFLYYHRHFFGSFLFALIIMGSEFLHFVPSFSAWSRCEIYEKSPYFMKPRDFSGGRRGTWSFHQEPRVYRCSLKKTKKSMMNFYLSRLFQNKV